jgi:hypothetical protein
MLELRQNRIEIGCEPFQLEYFLGVIICNVQQNPLFYPQISQNLGVTCFLVVL